MSSKRCAGILIPLFSLRTGTDLGRGEIGGLVSMADLGLAMGHQLIQLLPIDEVAPDETSPYSALSVFAIDPMYISARSLPGISRAIFADAQNEVGGAHARLATVKRRLLEHAYRFFSANADQTAREAYRNFVLHNPWVRDYAIFRTLKEKLSWQPWESWPDELKRHEPDALDAVARESADQVVMHSWFQYVAHWQWLDMRTKLAGRRIRLGGDLAFSPGRESVEVWANQEFFDLERSVGAPPDAFSATGQRWGLPMPNWQRMRESGFKFIRSRVRRARDLYDALRIDHVVGLFRTFGYPPDLDTTGAFDPPGEADQLVQGEEILKLICEEAGTTAILAEDLGVIPPFVRETLARLGMPGYKVMRWEKENWDSPLERFIDPARYPEVSLATTGTHDTETLTEWWRDAPEADRNDLVQMLKLADSANGPELSEPARDRILEAIYGSPSRYVIIPVQDLFGWSDRINTPGTIDGANWRWRIPFDLDRALDNPKIRARADKIREIVTRSGRFAPVSD